jgi:histone H2A
MPTTTATTPKPSTSKSGKLGLTLSIARVDKRLRTMSIAKRRVGGTASTYVTATIETVLKLVVEGASKIAVAQKSKQLLPRHIQVAILQDDRLNAVLGNISVGTRELIPDPIEWILTTEQQDKRLKKQKEAIEAKERAAVEKA